MFSRYLLRRLCGDGSEQRSIAKDIEVGFVTRSPAPAKLSGNAMSCFLCCLLCDLVRSAGGLER